MPESIDEIVVTGRRRGGNPAFDDRFNDSIDLGNRRADEIDREEEGRDEEEREDETSDTRIAFAPPVLPLPITEIVVTAQRTTTAVPRPFVSAGGSAGILAFAGVLASFFDQLGENLLQSAGFQATREVFQKTKDTKVQTIPEVIPEIVVTARRGDMRSLFPQVAPMPLLPGDYDPFIMIPISPVRVPLPQPDLPVIPGEVTIPTPTAPRILPVTIPVPTPTPFGIPFAFPVPIVSPSTRPGVSPRVAPLPFPTPLGVPVPTPVPTPIPVPTPVPTPTGIPNPLTGSRPGVVPLPQPSPQTTGNCPPCPKPKKCKKEKEKPRDQCFKKLVKEKLLPSQDESYEWTEIDCLTGRELD